MSLDTTKDMQFHYDLGKQLLELRQEGVLILGSGNMVHNLGIMAWQDAAFDWAIDYDTNLRQWILDDEYEPIIHYEKHGRAGLLAVNSGEHYEPLMYILALKEPSETVTFFAEKVTYGSISMRSVMIG